MTAKTFVRFYNRQLETFLVRGKEGTFIGANVLARV